MMLLIVAQKLVLKTKGNLSLWFLNHGKIHWLLCGVRIEHSS